MGVKYKKPYYILYEQYKWWIFSWDKEIARSPFFEEMEVVYSNLIKYEI